jgi:hypothetical protein
MKTPIWGAVMVVGAVACVALLVAAFQLAVLRTRIGEDAQRIARLEFQLLKAQDELRTIEVVVDDALQPQVLRARVGSELTYPREGQVWRVRKQPWSDTAGDGKEGV